MKAELNPAVPEGRRMDFLMCVISFSTKNRVLVLFATRSRTEGFPGCETFRAKTETVPSKQKQLAILIPGATTEAGV